MPTSDLAWLRDLKVSIQDERATVDITPAGIRAYLTLGGWTQSGLSDARSVAELWAHRKDAYVLVPLREDFRDYRRRVLEAVAAIAAAEERGALGVLLDLREASKGTSDART